MTKYHELTIKIEQLIDSEGTAKVLQVMSEICYEKAQHLRENWQDERQAKQWDKNAKAIVNVLPKLKA